MSTKVEQRVHSTEGLSPRSVASDDEVADVRHLATSECDAQGLPSISQTKKLDASMKIKTASDGESTPSNSSSYRGSTTSESTGRESLDRTDDSACSSCWGVPSVETGMDTPVSTARGGGDSKQDSVPEGGTNGDAPDPAVAGDPAVAVPVSSMQVNQTPFIQKLYAMLEDPHLSHVIAWGESCDSILVDPNEQFAKLLCLYFKHTNISSFVRQLSMYGFQKVNTHSRRRSKFPWEFRHMDGVFLRGDIGALRTIKRRLSRKSARNPRVRMHGYQNELADDNTHNENGESPSASSRLPSMNVDNDQMKAMKHNSYQQPAGIYSVGPKPYPFNGSLPQNGPAGQPLMNYVDKATVSAPVDQLALASINGDGLLRRITFLQHQMQLQITGITDAVNQLHQSSNEVVYLINQVNSGQNEQVPQARTSSLTTYQQRGSDSGESSSTGTEPSKKSRDSQPSEESGQDSRFQVKSLLN